MIENNVKPPLFNSGHALFITDAFPPRLGGSSVLNYNLLSCFDSNSFTVISRYTLGSNKIKRGKGMQVKRVIANISRLGKLNDLMFGIQLPLAIARIKALAKRKNTKIIIGTYPNLKFLALAQKIAKDLDLPFVAYLHDTIYEGNIGSRFELESKKLNKAILSESKRVFVMSDGMADLYKEKCKTKTIPLRHTYSEQVYKSGSSLIRPKKFFWGGAIYKINIVALASLSNCLFAYRSELELATNTPRKKLLKYGFNLDNCILTFYQGREQYISAIQNSDVLVLALDDEKDTSTHKDEIGTVFPTKTPEYLASGKPILVICPSNYFLAKYFIEHDCGFVYQKEDLKDFNHIYKDLSNKEKVNQKVANAKNMLELHFRAEMVQQILIENLNSV